MTGGQDDLVFDGDSIVVDGKACRGMRVPPQFEDGGMIADIDVATHTSQPDAVGISDGARTT
jgi:NAD+ synthase (glutamine-hydrolysing)